MGFTRTGACRSDQSPGKPPSKWRYRIGEDATATIRVGDADPALFQQLSVISEELRFVMITSEASLAPLDGSDQEPVKLGNGMTVAIKVSASEHGKCVRCWHHRPEVGNDTTHPELCARCIDNIDGQGEPRYYA